MNNFIVNNDDTMLPNRAEENVYQDFGYDEFMTKAVKLLKSLKRPYEGGDVLIDLSNENNGFKMINGVLYKHDDFAVQYLLGTVVDKQYDEALILLNGLDLKIVPQYIETITNGNERFVVTRVHGTKTGELIPLWKAGYGQNNLISKESLQAAYNDLQKLTNAGYVADNILNSEKDWFYTPDNHTVMLPVWYELRKIRTDESVTEIMEKYHRILFNE